MGNNHPTGITQLPNGPIDNVIEELQKSKAFIGIGSGLSWVSWATKTPTILISGFSEGFAETGLDTYRITAPKTKCSGCFNRYRLDAGDWNWCPDHKGTERQFECSKSIEYTEVIKMLKKVLD
jgi:autotransporter strand-loop-strand O-heptosyltransferase